MQPAEVDMDDRPSARFRLTLFGRFELSGPRGPIHLSSKKLIALVAFLACSAPRPQAREKLMTLLWGSHFDTQARQNLRQALSRLRRALGDDALVSTGESISLRPGVVTSDVARFEVLVSDGGWDALHEAVGLYRGRLLADLSIPEEAWSEWLEAEHQRLEGLALCAMVKLGEQAIQRGDHRQALEAAKRAIAVSRLREDAHRLMMRALAADGRRADALKHFEYVAALLQRELNVEPDAATVSLGTELRRSQPLQPAAETSSNSQLEPKDLEHVAGQSVDGILSRVLAGERKQVTVLCVDLGKSMELIARRDAEEALKIFDAFVAVVSESVRRFDGTVNLVANDGLMALFGAPTAHEDHALRACYAALHVQEVTARKVRELQRGHDIPVAARVGLASGEVVIRSRGRAETPSIVMGSAVHVARGMLQAAPPGGVLVSIDTQRLAEGHFNFRVREGPDSSSVDQPVHELVGLPTGRTRFQVSAARGLTGFVGRSAELEHLERLLVRAQAGQGQVVSIIGEPGLGKSRLLHEFTRAHRGLRLLTLEAASFRYDTTSSYLPVTEMLRTYFGIAPGSAPHDARDKVVSRVISLDRQLEPDLPALLSLVYAPIEDESWQTLDAGQRRQRTLDALKRLILCECRRQPVVLAFEDLQWVDSETQAFLRTLVDSLASAPLLLILVFRPEYQHPWGGKSFYTQLRLNPLSLEATDEFLHNLLGNDASLAALKKLLSPHRNPLLLEESVRALVETGFLVGRRGNYRLDRSLEKLPIAPAVHALLAARIDRLPPRDKALLQAASAFGSDVPHVILQSVAGLPDDDLRHGLAALRDAELLYESRLFPDVEYTFKHALTHEVTYAGVLRERRRELHRRIVETVEALYKDSLDEHFERLAHHAAEAELGEKAIHYQEQAGIKAAARSAHQTSRLWFDRALETLGAMPPSSDRDQQELMLLVSRGVPLTAIGGYGSPEVIQNFRRAHDVYRRLGGVPQISAGLQGLYRFYKTTGQLETAAEFIASLRDFAQAAGDRVLLMQVHRQEASVNLFRGDLDRAQEHHEKTLALFDPARSPHRDHQTTEWQTAMRCEEAELSWLRGFPDRSAQSMRAALDHAREIDHPRNLAYALLFVASLHQRRGDIVNTLSLAEECLALSSQRGLPIYAAGARILRAWAMASKGEQVDRAIDEMREDLGVWQRSGLALYSPYFLSCLAEAYRMAGRPSDALQPLSDMLAASERIDVQYWIPELHRLKGELLLEINSRGCHQKQAEACFLKAIEIARTQGSRSLELRAAMSLAKLWCILGRRAEASDHLAAAYGSFDEGFDTADLRAARRLLDSLSCDSR
jgi:DNA-binding SARP family transcriptional activator